MGADCWKAHGPHVGGLGARPAGLVDDRGRGGGVGDHGLGVVGFGGVAAGRGGAGPGGRDFCGGAVVDGLADELAAQGFVGDGREGPGGREREGAVMDGFDEQRIPGEEVEAALDPGGGAAEGGGDGGEVAVVGVEQSATVIGLFRGREVVTVHVFGKALLVFEGAFLCGHERWNVGEPCCTRGGTAVGPRNRDEAVALLTELQRDAEAQAGDGAGEPVEVVRIVLEPGGVGRAGVDELKRDGL